MAPQHRRRSINGTEQKFITPDAKPQRFTIFAHTRDGRETINMIIWPSPLADLAEGDAITPAEVLGWMRDAAPNWLTPDINSPSLASFTHVLNVLRLTELPQLDTTSPWHQRAERVKKAILTLLEDVPPMIEGDRRGREQARREGREPFIPQAHAGAIVRLLQAAEEARGAFLWFTPRTRDEPWHDDAANIAWRARKVWQSAGRKSIGSNPTSPLVKLIAAALVRIGDGERSPDAISKALQRHKGFTAEFSLNRPRAAN